jgi:hypothetical protein
MFTSKIFLIKTKQKQKSFFQTFYYSLAASIGQYIYDYYLKTYIPASTLSSQTSLLPTTTENQFSQCQDQSNSVPAQQWAQQKSSNLFFYQTVASSIPIILMTYILGLYTHQLGRKFVLVLTMFGNIFQYAIWLFIIYYQVSSEQRN